MFYCNDLVADNAALRFNVSWERTSPMVMSVRDDNVRTIMSGESSFYFGRTAYGDVDAVKSFYFACSASLAPACLLVLPVLFLSIEPVGEPDGYVDNYWDNHRSLENSESISIIQDDVQIKKRNDVDDNYDLYRNISRELNFFHWGNAVPAGADGKNGSIFKTILIITSVPYMWGLYYVGDKILNGLCSDRNIINIKLEFNRKTNKTDVIIYY